MFYCWRILLKYYYPIITTNFINMQPSFIDKLKIIKKIKNYIQLNAYRPTNLCRIPKNSVINYAKMYSKLSYEKFMVLEIIHSSDEYICYYKDTTNIEYIINMKKSTKRITGLYVLTVFL